MNWKSFKTFVNIYIILFIFALSIHFSMSLFMFLLIHRFTQLCIYSFNYLFVYFFTELFIHSFAWWIESPWKWANSPRVRGGAFASQIMIKSQHFCHHNQHRLHGQLKKLSLGLCFHSFTPDLECCTTAKWKSAQVRWISQKCSMKAINLWIQIHLGKTNLWDLPKL